MSDDDEKVLKSEIFSISGVSPTEICFAKPLSGHNIINNSNNQNASFLTLTLIYVAMKICSISE
jgi:hypothetical protein